MSTLIRENLRAATVHVPAERTARLTVDREVALQQHNGTRINDLSTLWPFAELRARCFSGAKKWVADMAKRGEDLLTAEADIRVYGPYKSRAGTYHAAAPKRGAVRAVGYAEDEDGVNPAAADYVFKATFISRRHRPVQTKAEA